MKPSPAPHESAELTLTPPASPALAHVPGTITPVSLPSPITILEAAVRGGITAENVAVVKELAQLCREQRADEAKAEFAKAFFRMRRNMPVIYADREAKDRSGNTVYTYCSEEEISRALEPHWMAHGFAPLFGQKSEGGMITVEVTLMHEAGHSETRSFSVRSGTPNAMKDGAMCDAGGATTAWRHLMTKWFGLKSRISPVQDATVIGEKIAPDKVQYLRELVRETKANEAKFLEFARVARYEDIGEADYARVVAALEKKRQ
jgi:hypothetical protein